MTIRWECCTRTREDNKPLLLCVQMKKIARRQQQQQQQQEQEQMGGTRRGPSRGGRQSNDDSEGKTRTDNCVKCLDEGREPSSFSSQMAPAVTDWMGCSHIPLCHANNCWLWIRTYTAASSSDTGSRLHSSAPSRCTRMVRISYCIDFSIAYSFHWLKCLCLNTEFISDSETVFHDLDSDGSLSHLGDCLLTTAEGGVLAGRIGNPIDRLYSMQNSYFTSWPWFHLPEALHHHCRGQQIDESH